MQALFSSRTRVALLRIFLTAPDKDYYLREIGRMLNESTTPIRRELLNLKRIGLLVDSKVANLIYYKVNKDFPLFNELYAMVKKTEQEKI